MNFRTLSKVIGIGICLKFSTFFTYSIKCICLKRFYCKNTFNFTDKNTIFRRKFTAKAVMFDVKGAPKSEIRGSEDADIFSLSGGYFDPVRPSSTDHAVLYKIPEGTYRPGLDWLRPSTGGVDKWDDSYVRLPCSPKNMSKNEQRWSQISGVLLNVVNRQVQSGQELSDAILSYNQKYKTEWLFGGLHDFCNHLYEPERNLLFNKTLPEIAALALELPKLFGAPIPLMKQGVKLSVSMTQQQISCLLANAFFCTFPWRNSKASGRSSSYQSYPNINFWRLFNARGDDVTEKLKCLIHYFRRVCPNPITHEVPKGVVTFVRRSVPKQDCPHWWSSQVNIGEVPLNIDPNGAIEHQDAIIQVDFANKYLGGGVLGRGSVQEEIRFSVSPELMASMLFVEMMDDNEAVMIIGAELYSKHIGYSRSFTYTGNYVDNTPHDTSGRRQVAVLAIDAMKFDSKREEYQSENIRRELNKAWVGFSFYTQDKNPGIKYPGVATGNWGCGAFGGSPQLKSLIQLMACAQAGRPMTYITFGDQKFTDQFFDMYTCLRRNNVTVGRLFNLIRDFSNQDKDLVELYKYLHNAIEGSNSRRSDPQSRSRRSLDKKQQTITDLMRNELHSPDLFSQEDDQSETGSQNKHTDTNKTKERYQSRQNTSKISYFATKMLNSDNKMACTERKVADSQNKIENSQMKKDVYQIEVATTQNKMANSQQAIARSQLKMTDYQQKMATTENKIAVSQYKTVDSQSSMGGFQHTMATTKSKFTSDENKITTEKKMTDSRQKIAYTESRLANTETKMADHQHKMAADKTKTSQTSRLFEEIQKFDEENGRLNLSVTHTTDTAPRNCKRTSVVLLDSESSADEDEKQNQMKKKLSRKITDYFSRKRV